MNGSDGKTAPAAPEIDLTQVARIKPRYFVVDMVIDNQALRLMMAAMNLESLAAELTVATAANLPRIGGWNVFDERGTLLMSVSAVARISLLAEQTPLKSGPGDKASAGWRAIPVVTGISPDFQRSIEDAKREGRIPQ